MRQIIAQIFNSKRQKALLIAFFCTFALTSCTAQTKRFDAHYSGIFDTLITFIAYTPNEETFYYYAGLLFNRLYSLHMHFDIFNEYEGINNIRTINLNAGISPVEVSQDIIDLVLLAQYAYELTSGAANIALGPVLTIWHSYRALGVSNPSLSQLPSVENLNEAAKLASMAHVIIDEENSTIFLEKPGMSLDVGTIAKGFAAELAMNTVAQAGLETALLSAGGHLVAMGTTPERGYWRMGIQNPDLRHGLSPIVDTVSLTDVSVSVSGGHLRFFSFDNQNFGHIIDPVTLFPPVLHRQVTVLHESSWMADVISTALFILPYEEGRTLANSVGAEAFWIDAYGNYMATEGYIRVSSIFSEADLRD